MSGGLTVKREKFINGLLEGKSQRQAFIDAGYSSKNKTPEYLDIEACKLLKVPKVNQRYNELREKAQDKAILTRSQLLDKLSLALDMAIGSIESEHATFCFGELKQGRAKKTNLNAVASIAEKIAKLEGWNKEKTEEEKQEDKLDKLMKKVDDEL